MGASVPGSVGASVPPGLVGDSVAEPESVNVRKRIKHKKSEI